MVQAGVIKILDFDEYFRKKVWLKFRFYLTHKIYFPLFFVLILYKSWQEQENTKQLQTKFVRFSARNYM